MGKLTSFVKWNLWGILNITPFAILVDQTFESADATGPPGWTSAIGVPLYLLGPIPFLLLTYPFLTSSKTRLLSYTHRRLTNKVQALKAQNAELSSARARIAAEVVESQASLTRLISMRDKTDNWAKQLRGAVKTISSTDYIRSQASDEAETLANELRYIEKKISKAERQDDRALASIKSAKAQGSSFLNGGQADRPIDPDHFESVCADFMRKLGHNDAKKTPKGRDKGIDIIAKNAIGQSKFFPGRKVSAPAIQQLAGAAQQHRAELAYFFAYGDGFTDDAISSARATGVILYSYGTRDSGFKRVQ